MRKIFAFGFTIGTLALCLSGCSNTRTANSSTPQQSSARMSGTNGAPSSLASGDRGPAGGYGGGMGMGGAQR